MAGSLDGTKQVRRVAVAPRVIAVLVGVAVVGAGTFVLAGNPRPGSKATPPKAAVRSSDTPVLLVESLTVRTEMLPGAVQRLSGQVEALHTATVAAEVAGKVEARPIERGSRVGSGSLLAALDADAAQATLGQAVAARNQATAARRQLEAEYDRTSIETAAAIEGAQASLSQADAGERKARTFTRTQELKQAEASLSQAQTDVRLAKIELDRYEMLVREGAVAQQQLDRAQATYDAAIARQKSAEEAVSLAQEGARQEDIQQASAQVSAAKANLNAAKARPARLTALKEQIAALRAQEAQAAATIASAQIQLRKHRITAPFSGRVLETLIERGEMASPGTPIAKIADIRQVKAIFAVPEAARGQLVEGGRVSLSADALTGKSFVGRITQIGFEADPRSRAFRVEVTVENPGEILLPNMVARLNLSTGAAERRVVVPVAAVATDGGRPYVFLIQDGKAVRREVTLGAPISGNRVAVAAGLSGGQAISAAPQRLTDGVQVRINTAEGM